MTDRELLELAAKAAGYALHLYVNNVHHYEKLQLRDDSKHWSQWEEWNPLTDDGDALRLAVKLRIKSRYHSVLGQGLAWTEGDAAEFRVNVEDCGRDECAATRRAIVLTAASRAQK